MFDLKTNTDGTITVSGVDAKWLKKAMDHQVYLDGYRKQYSKTRSAKVQAIRAALESRGVDVKKLEAEAVAKVRKG